MLLEDTRRLEKIDKLYSLRLDQLVSLPSLVVVGDQSSGKSSVLEALTGLPLPRDSGLCTRFATQILFKRSVKERIDVAVIPALEPDRDLQNALRVFTSAHSRNGAVGDSNSRFDILDVLNDAAHLMKVPAAGRVVEEGLRSFSQDILKIELSGPSYEHFSVIDLPGLFRKPTPGQTTKDDVPLVRQMVLSYLQNPRSIILAVVPANVDIATQEIVQMAEDADPGRQRTLGVLTKPDLVDTGAEHEIIDLVAEKDGRAGLGYIIVCNRSQSKLETSLAARHTNEEDFFQRSPWNLIPRPKTGIVALKRCLDEVLVEVTRTSFQDVLEEIHRRLAGARQEFDDLGSPRDTLEAQRLYLLQTSSRFQTLIHKATDAQYGRDECFQTMPVARLATLVMSENDKFSSTMFRKGFRRRSSTEKDSDTDSDSEAEKDKETIGHAINTEDSVPVDDIASDFPLLRTMMKFDETEPAHTQEPTEKWVGRHYHDSKGFEIGGINPSLISTLVFEQTSGWAFYALQHVSVVVSHIHRCIRSLLCHVCPDVNVRRRIWERMMPGLGQAYRRAFDHARFLVNTERRGYPITLNHYFTSMLKKKRIARVEKQLRLMKSWQINDDSREPLIRLSDTLNVYISNEQHVIHDLTDIVRSYHKVARKRFVDNICKQVVDAHLICSPDGPLYVLSPEFVGRLDEAELCRLAGEDESTATLRKRLGSDIDSLVRGRSILED